MLHILRYDYLLLWRSKMLGVCLGALTVFVGFALWSGQQRVDFQKNTLRYIAGQEAQLHAESRAVVADLEQRGAVFSGNSHRDPSEPGGAANATGNRYFTLPPAPLALTATGQSDLQPYYYKFSLNKKQALYHQEEIDNASILYNGYFDLSFVIVWLLPLLAIALTYNIASAERERGTIFLLSVADGVTPKTVAIGKFAGRFGLLWGAFSALTLTGLVLSGVSLRANAAETTGLLGLAGLYTAFWYALGFGISQLGRSSGFNAAMLLGTWLLLLVVIPALLGVVAEAVYPPPSRLELIAETREASDEARKNSAALLSQYYEDHPELAPADGRRPDPKNFAVVSLRSALEVEKTLQPLEEAFVQHQARREALAHNFRLLSPAIFVRQMLEDLAGVGPARYRDFDRQMHVAHAAYRQFFAAKIFRLEKMTAADYDQIPKAVFQPTPHPVLRAADLANTAWLLAACAGLIFLGLSRHPKLALARM
jgi:ABC-2 type transport system permease protein